MFDKLLGSMMRRAENRTRDKALKTVREFKAQLRLLTGSCRLLIDAGARRGFSCRDGDRLGALGNGGRGGGVLGAGNVDRTPS
jgi:hypothetical protein